MTQNSPNSENIHKPYSLENLQKLMAESDGYAALSPQEKANIQEHIRLNNKPVLIYIYQTLLEESEAINFSRENLAKKILKTSPADLEAVKKSLKNL